MAKNKVVTTSEFNGHTVIGDSKPLDYNCNQLQKNQELLDRTIDRHTKVMIVRMDLRYSRYQAQDPNNENLSTAMRTFTRELSRKGLDPQYVVRREQLTSEHPHAHVAVIVNASVKQCYKPIVEAMVAHWGRAIGVDAEEAKDLVWACDKDPSGGKQENGIIIRRGTPEYQEQYDKVYKQLSYLAKNDPDDVTPSGERKIFYSQYKRKKSRSKK
ncbi:MAG: inovirus-type Gp2 protein [Victivallaceae bacterium]|nr:inovirus-type Gp2 protein [Victivallaceae bacterium]